MPQVFGPSAYCDLFFFSEAPSMPSKRKPAEIVGIVDRYGSGGCKTRNEKLWTLSFYFQSWQRTDGETVKQPLRVIQKGLSDGKLKKMMAAIRPKDTLRILAHVRGNQATLVKILGKEEAAGGLKAELKEMERKKTWKEKELGTFTQDEEGWVKTFSLPEFKAFKYSSKGRSGGRSKIPLRFICDEPREPTRGEVAVAKKVLKNLRPLIVKLKKSLFDDMQGRGPDSGMWWHGDRETLAEILAWDRKKPLPLDKPDDLNALLGDPEIWIYPSVYGYEKPCAILCFEALFEEEHGVGVLTDGTKILGTGYSTDVGPFQ
jgi:hypothetical protein